MLPVTGYSLLIFIILQISFIELFKLYKIHEISYSYTHIPIEILFLYRWRYLGSNLRPSEY
jgi:hypothetical protein